MAGKQCSAALPQESMQRVNRRRQLRTVSTNQVQRRELAILPGKYLHQSTCLQIVNEVQPRLVDKAFPGYRPATNCIGIVADAIACDGHGALAARRGKVPPFMYLLAPDEPKAVVLPQILNFGRCAMPFEV